MSVIRYFALLGMLINPAAMADIPEQCVQDIQRSSPCPNLIYKQANVAVPALNISPGDTVCICKTDFAGLLREPTSKVEEITQRSRLMRMSADLGMEQDQLVALLKH